ncbi:hypothetical protein PLCT2_02029 [Planctomycetaceae bacterium]|nr:hypothetical protein PLCT2_02029 [Planctomycetaceae bacterium]
MRVLYTLLGAFLVAGGAFLAALVNAEAPQAPQPVQMGDSTAPVADLDALAMRVLNAIRTESFGDVYDCFIPYRQTAEGLAREEETYRFEGGDLAWEEVRSGIEGKRGTDPLGKLKLQTLKDYRALELRQWVALNFGCWRIYRNGDLEDRLKASWFSVERHTGLRASKKDAYGHLQPSGTIMFRNRLGDTLRVLAISANGKWYVEDFVFQIGRVRGGSVPVADSEVADPRVVNAKNTCILIFTRMRQTYQAGKDSLPPSPSFETLGIKPGELDGKYYTYDIKFDGNKSDGFKGTVIKATPKKGVKLGGVTLTVDTLKNEKGYSIRDDSDD